MPPGDHSPLLTAAIRTCDDHSAFATGGRDCPVCGASGHSVDVAFEPTDAPVPDELYHGTAPSTLESIRESGLQPTT